MKIVKSISVFIVLIFSLFIGYKSYIILDFTVGNTLHGVYNSYIFADKSIDKTIEVTKNVTNSIVSLKSKLLDNKIKRENLKNKIEEDKKQRNLEKTKSDLEIYYMKIFINIIPILIALYITYKIFTLIMIPIIDENSIFRKIVKWVKDKKDED